jgi:hypothetical protein
MAKRANDQNYTPFLVIGYVAPPGDPTAPQSPPGDDGTRPLPQGAVWWESPNVYAVNAAGVPDQPTAGQPNTVYAWVSNLGASPSSATVSFYWCNPSLAITSAQLIGAATGVAIGAATAGTTMQAFNVLVACPTQWTPVYQNNGHECLIAVASDPVLDPAPGPLSASWLDPTLDRHFGQKNEQVLDVTPGQDVVVELETANVTAIEQRLTFEVTPVIAKTSALPVRRSHPKTPLLPPTFALATSIRTGTGPAFFVAPAPAFASRLLASTLEAMTRAAWTTWAPIVAATADFGPWEGRTIQVAATIPKNARPGQTFAYRVTQRVGPIVVGGYTVHAVVGG